MSNSLGDDSLTPRSWGFRKETGSWEIDVGVADAHTLESLNKTAITQVEVFLQAFHKLCRPVEMRCETITFNQLGAIINVEEGQTKHIEPNSSIKLTDEIISILKDTQTTLLTTIFTDCDLSVLINNPEGDLKQVWMPKTGTFYFGYVMEDDGTNRLIATDSSVCFTLSLDAWVKKTLDSQSLEWLDNSASAAQNQPLLEEALKYWEALTHQPIVEWNSRYYQGQIFRYGFKN